MTSFSTEYWYHRPRDQFLIVLSWKYRQISTTSYARAVSNWNVVWKWRVKSITRHSSARLLAVVEYSVAPTSEYSKLALGYFVYTRSVLDALKSVLVFAFGLRHVETLLSQVWGLPESTASKQGFRTCPAYVNQQYERLVGQVAFPLCHYCSHRVLLVLLQSQNERYRPITTHYFKVISRNPIGKFCYPRKTNVKI